MKKKIKKTQTDKVKKKIKRLFAQDPKKELTIKAISKRINYAGPSSHIHRILHQLSKEKVIFEIRRGKYSGTAMARSRQQSNAPSQRLTGRVDLTRSGAGYILVDGMENDIYVTGKNLRGALSNDIVEIQVTKVKRNGRPEGVVTAIKERAIQDVVATIHTVTHRAYATPLHDIGVKEFAIDLDDLSGAEQGDIVLLEVVHWPEKRFKSPIAKVMEVITDYEDHELSELAILTKHGFNYIFPSSIKPELAEIEAKGVNWDPEKREDYRDVLTFTIDPADAKEFDDALSYEAYENGDVEIGVHIADVTHYLQKDTALDKEATRRSTSVYLVGRVCPMLPETLSNDLCSLVQGKDRLTFAVTFRVSPDNKIIDYWIRKTIIKSNRRFTYEQAQEIIEGKRSWYKKPLMRIKEFADHFRASRNAQGAINFESEEVRFLLDEKKHPTDIYTKERKDAHLMVEDLMLLANKTIAEFIDKKSNGKVPLPYRVHDEPDIEKIADLALMGKVLGFDFNYENTNQIRSSFNRLHDAARKNEAFTVLEKLGIRSMAKAIYTSNNIGHFGLAFSHYAHFTSPIRRYADVLVHRIVYAFLERDSLLYEKGKLEAICTHISRRERLALDAERESIKLKQAEYMEQFVGDVFDGKISGMIDKGIFVSIGEGYGEGLIVFSKFDEPFELHRNGFSAKGSYTGKIYALGDRVRVEVEEVDIDQRRIELVMVE